MGSAGTLPEYTIKLRDSSSSVKAPFILPQWGFNTFGWTSTFQGPQPHPDHLITAVISAVMES